jgi:hypothetical protein
VADRRTRPFYNDTDGTLIGWEIRCPACRSWHRIWTERPYPTTKARWTFNGNVESPSFSPSVNISCTPHKGHTYRCHFVVTNGQISYCGDCTHEMKGQTADLPVVEDEDAAG